MAGRDYMTASPGMRRRTAQKTWVRSSQEPRTTRHTSAQKLVFTKSQ